MHIHIARPSFCFFKLFYFFLLTHFCICWFPKDLHPNIAAGTSEGVGIAGGEGAHAKSTKKKRKTLEVGTGGMYPFVYFKK